MSVKIFTQIVKEYRAAEKGETNGIKMERKSILMKAHKKQIKKMIVATLGMGLFAMIICKAMFEDIADQYIENEFRLMRYKNETSISFNVDPTTLWAFGDK